MYPASPRQQLQEMIAQLSDRQIQLVLQFIQMLLPKSLPETVESPIDPLADFVGGVNHGSLAQEIDVALYD